MRHLFYALELFCQAGRPPRGRGGRHPRRVCHIVVVAAVVFYVLPPRRAGVLPDEKDKAIRFCVDGARRFFRNREPGGSASLA